MGLYLYDPIPQTKYLDVTPSKFDEQMRALVEGRLTGIDGTVIGVAANPREGFTPEPTDESVIAVGADLPPEGAPRTVSGRGAQAIREIRAAPPAPASTPEAAAWPLSCARFDAVKLEAGSTAALRR